MWLSPAAVCGMKVLCEATELKDAVYFSSTDEKVGVLYSHSDMQKTGLQV